MQISRPEAGMGAHIARIMGRVVDTLIDQELLILVEGADRDALVAEIMVHLQRAPGFAQVGSYLSAGLMKSPLVDELYADDQQILEVMNYLNG